ncbi:hypothetical protein EhV18_00350 [Emiliania huxleyi virus 18]|nr:hypothetical protein EhV18_00350 [Emiliania huxleyi virus 18]AHA55436.1 hypothetical protein EhV156_00341 [Emiliania huxleyi virus 156]
MNGVLGLGRIQHGIFDETDETDETSFRELRL